MLTSPANPLLKDVRKAISSGGLTERGYLLAETFHLLDEALRSGLDIKAILASESANAAVGARAAQLEGVRTVVVEDGVFAKLGSTESSQGVIALVKPPVWKLEQMFHRQSPLVVLDGVQDPGNAGSIVRAAEAFGATGVLFTKGTVSPYNPKTLRASAGSLFRVPFVSGLTASAVRAALQQREVEVFATVRHPGAKVAPGVDLRTRCALIIGSEAHGVSDALRAGATTLSIQTAWVESLNAAVAAGILLYEAERQRLQS